MLDNNMKKFDGKDSRDAVDELAAQCKDIDTFDELVTYLKYVKDDRNVSCEDMPHAIAQACLAVGWYFAKDFGITGYQASFVMWDFISGWQKTDNKTSLKLMDYDDMLYPQYDYKFEKTISQETWQRLQDAAAKLICDADENSKQVDPGVYNHWKSIVNGEIPFGYRLKK